MIPRPAHRPGRLQRLILVLALVSAGPAPAAWAQERGQLLERVAEVLGRSYYDKAFREEQLPALVQRYTPRAAAATTLDGERQVVHEFLANIPVSHLGLLSERGRDEIFDELTTKRVWMFGFQLVEQDQGWFVDWVYEDGPANRAGLRRGDRVLLMDGLHPRRSRRVDWRTDDCALPDPAIHSILAEPDDLLRLEIERRPGDRSRVNIEAARYSGWEGSKKSVRVIEVGPYSVGYVHYWFIPMQGGSTFLQDLCAHRFRNCDALVFDLRGRGGAAHEALRIVGHLDAKKGVWRRPLVLLTDDTTRSAKEVITSDLQRRNSAVIVGERTAGAVIPASFKDVGSETVLMYPSFTLGDHTARLEGKGVEPDIPVAYPLAWTAGADPILEAGLLAAQAWCEELSPVRR